MKRILKFLTRILVLFVIVLVVILLIVVQPVFEGESSESSVVNSTTLKKHVYQLSETLPKLVPKDNLINTSGQYIFDEISKFTKLAEFQNYGVEGENYKNIVIKYSGSENCGTYVIGAHYDTYDNLPGADDNMSGVAGLIELVRLYSSNSPKCDLDLVFYSLEEPPYFRSEHMGSFVHAKSLFEANAKIEMMLSLETIGYFNDQPNSQHYPIKGAQYLYSDTGNYISIVGDLSQIGITRFLKKHMRKASSLPVHSFNAPSSIQGIDFSDHLNYWHFDYPAVMITDTAFNRNENYHTEFDTPDRLDYIRMAKVIDGVYYAINAHMQNQF